MAATALMGAIFTFQAAPGFSLPLLLVTVSRRLARGKWRSVYRLLARTALHSSNPAWQTETTFEEAVVNVPHQAATPSGKYGLSTINSVSGRLRFPESIRRGPGTALVVRLSCARLTRTTHDARHQ
jgi:hypothetical protein